jgi:membrane protease YdiL (CAAX protease family)
MYLPSVSVFKERSRSVDALVPVIIIIWVTGIFWFIGSKSWNPFAGSAYPYESFVVVMPTITLIVPTLAFLYATKGSFRSARLTFDRFESSVLLGLVAAAILLLPTIIFSNRFTLGLEKASALYLFALGYQAVCEEVFFRGFLQTRMENLLGSVNGLVVTAIIFNLYHLPADIFAYGLSTTQSVANVGFTLPLAVILGYLALRSDSLVGSSIYHIAYNLPLILRH